MAVWQDKRRLTELVAPSLKRQPRLDDSRREVHVVQSRAVPIRPGQDDLVPGSQQRTPAEFLAGFELPGYEVPDLLGGALGLQVLSDTQRESADAPVVELTAGYQGVCGQRGVGGVHRRRSFVVGEEVWEEAADVCYVHDVNGLAGAQPLGRDGHFRPPCEDYVSVGEEDVFFVTTHVADSLLPQFVHPGSWKAYHTAFFGGMHEQLVQIAHDKHREPDSSQSVMVHDVLLRIAYSSDLRCRIYIEGNESRYIFLSPIEHGGPSVKQALSTQCIEEDVRP